MTALPCHQWVRTRQKVGPLDKRLIPFKMSIESSVQSVCFPTSILSLSTPALTFDVIYNERAEPEALK